MARARPRKRVQAFLTAGAMIAFAALAARLFGLHTTLLATALLAFEPFFLAYQRFITTDALAADLGAIAALLFLLHLREGGHRWLLLSAPIFGLAAVTKVPVVLMAVPMAAWVILVDRGYWPAFAPQPTRRRAAELAVWAAIALGTIVVVWPALWVRPLQTAWRLWSALRYEVEANAGRMDDSRWDFYARVAAWLSERPGAESMVVVAHFAPAFAPYFNGRTVGMPLARPVRDRRADAAVVYIRQVQGMATEPVLLAEIRSRPLLHVVTLHGVDYAWIYAGPIVLPEWWQEREPPPPSRSGP
jgi:hypothetical protein